MQTCATRFQGPGLGRVFLWCFASPILQNGNIRAILSTMSVAPNGGNHFWVGRSVARDERGVASPTDRTTLPMRTGVKLRARCVFGFGRSAASGNALDVPCCADEACRIALIKLSHLFGFDAEASGHSALRLCDPFLRATKICAMRGKHFGPRAARPGRFLRRKCDGGEISQELIPAHPSSHRFNILEAKPGLPRLTLRLTRRLPRQLCFSCILSLV